ncbi:MAG TPA: hybrid sensor histidine kinase/response regulator [Candidatus Limnocylindria bacterium]|nr:hybrid sensor histidine kinase/response regulator [Candidatus Limnocylindria bacterium]
MSKPSRVLGVDDNPQNLGILRKALGSEFELTTVDSGVEALTVARRLRPDVVLLDIMMPGIDGYETCRRMRSSPELRGTKILLISAKALASERLQGYDVGADDYMIKPFDPYELLAKVRVYTRLRSVEEVDRLKTEVLSLLSHETRTPLAAILGPLPLILESKNLTDEQRRMLMIVERGGSRLLALIEKGLYLAQLRSGSVEISLAALDLDRLAGSALERMRSRAEKAGVRLERESGHPPPVEADEAHLGWALDALLDNAIRFSPAGETVTVRTANADGRASVSISDRGPGVAADVLPKIFGDFVVADINHHSKGSGLSLAAARSIVDLHGGALSLDSNLGPGATFRIELPTTEPQSAAA